MMFDLITRPSSITAAAVSSHELSMPRTNIRSHSTRHGTLAEPPRRQNRQSGVLLSGLAVLASLRSWRLGGSPLDVVAYARFPEGEKMKAAILREYKQPLQIEDTETP